MPQAPGEVAGQASSVEAFVLDVVVLLIKNAASLLALGVILRVFFRPTIDRAILAAMTRQGPDAREWINGLYRERIERTNRILDAAERASLDLQHLQREVQHFAQDFGHVKKQLAEFPRFTDALERLDDTLTKFVDKLDLLSTDVNKMQGRWDGIERRLATPPPAR